MTLSIVGASVTRRVSRALPSLTRRLTQSACTNCACQPPTPSSQPQPKSESELPPPRVKCDPYGQGGHPLPPARVQSLLLTLDADWSYDAATNALSKSFSFRELTEMSMFSFVTSLGNISTNSGHSYYQLTVVPRKRSATVTLKTVSLHGLSFADFAFATQCDGEYHRVTSARSR